MTTAASSKIPVPVKNAREKLEKLGLDVTMENIEKHLDAKEVNALFGSLRTALQKPGCNVAKDIFINADKGEKKSMLAQYILDPELSTLGMTNAHMKETLDVISRRRMWLTINQMAGPLMFNSLEDAELIAKDLQSRDHEKPSMAAAGKMQYLNEVSEEVYKELHKDVVELTAKALLGAEDFKKVRTAMEDRDTKRVKIKKEPTPLTVEQLEQKAQEDARKKIVANCTLTIATLKRNVDRARKVYNTSLDHSNGLQAKGYPKEMSKHYERQLIPLNDAIVEALEKWKGYSVLDLSKSSLEQIDELKVKIDSDIDAVEGSLKQSDQLRKDIAKVAK